MSSGRSLGGALIIAAVVCVPAVLGVRAAAVPAGEAWVQTGGDHTPLVGTYRLVIAEVRDPDGTCTSGGHLYWERLPPLRGGSR